MKKRSLLILTVLCGILLNVQSFAGTGEIISKRDYKFLEEMTRDVLEAARIRPGDTPTAIHPQNNTGGTVICPGGAYPSYWIRDYAMSLDCGMVDVEEQRHMLLLTARTQCDRTWLTAGGSMVQLGAIADHVRVDDALPIYYPGTYDYKGQGTPAWGTLPPYCDEFFFVDMAAYYVYATDNKSILNLEINGKKLIDRLEMAFNCVPGDLETHLVTANDIFRGVDFGFRDVVTITGELAFPSILKYRAAQELSALFALYGNQVRAEEYGKIAGKLKEAIPATFADERGMLRASTGKSAQADVWSTALAMYYGIMAGEPAELTSATLAEAYKKGTLAYKGNIRHVLTSDDFNERTAWEVSMAGKNTYQNGAFWGTPTGWVCYAISRTDPEAARSLASEYIADLRETDYRKGGDNGGPWECFHPDGNHRQNNIYLTTVSVPLAVFRSMMNGPELK